MKSNFILDLKVRFKGGVLSPLFYQNSTRLRGTQLVTALANRAEGSGGGQPDRPIWRMGTGRKGAGDGSCVPLEGGGGETRLCRTLGSALVDGRETARISLEVI